MDTLEQHEATFDKLEDRIKIDAAPFIHEIDILTSMSGISVMTAIAIVADIMK
ncbi:hypothetical protein LQZ19_14895 [Treponema primitia]|uniref:hypothetical protein n=1 Tax=Treponema primitia TaxID=88058 RepID=UPI00398109AD